LTRFFVIPGRTSHAFPAFVEEQPVEVIGQVVEGELRFGAG
jgi:hypothetical protein